MFDLLSSCFIISKNINFAYNLVDLILQNKYLFDVVVLKADNIVILYMFSKTILLIVINLLYNIVMNNEQINIEDTNTQSTVEESYISPFYIIFFVIALLIVIITITQMTDMKKEIITPVKDFKLYNYLVKNVVNIKGIGYLMKYLDLDTIDDARVQKFFKKLSIQIVSLVDGDQEKCLFFINEQLLEDCYDDESFKLYMQLLCDFLSEKHDISIKLESSVLANFVNYIDLLPFEDQSKAMIWRNISDKLKFKQLEDYPDILRSNIDNSLYASHNVNYVSIKTGASGNLFENVRIKCKDLEEFISLGKCIRFCNSSKELVKKIHEPDFLDLRRFHESYGSLLKKTIFEISKRGEKDL